MEAEIVESSFKDRISESEVYHAYNDNDDDRPGKGKPTGTLFDIAQVKNLCVLEFKYGKKFYEEDKIQNRSYLLKRIEKLNLKVVAVVTSSGDFQVYCNQDDFFLNTVSQPVRPGVIDEQTTIYGHSSLSIPGEKKIMLPGSKSRRNHHEPVNYYEFVVGDWDTKIKSSIEEVMDLIDSWVPKIDFNDDEFIEPALRDSIKNTVIGEKLIDAIEERLKQPLKISMNEYFNMFASINTMMQRDQFREFFITANDYKGPTYQYVYAKNGIAFLIQKIRSLDPTYYDEKILPLLGKQCLINIQRINCQDDFDLSLLRTKAEQGLYNFNTDELINDFSRILRIFQGNTIEYYQKIKDPVSDRFVIQYVPPNVMKETLTMTRITIKQNEKNKSVSLWDILRSNTQYLTVTNKVFYNPDPKLNIITIFQGYKYFTKDPVDNKLIEPYLNMCKEVICDNNEKYYNYILGWIAKMIQNPGTKNEVAIVLKGLQGAGKNTFTNVIAEITTGYSERNITSIDELTGTFNSVIENKIFIVLNEMKNAGEERMVNFDQLKSIITDETFRVNEKMQKRRTIENVCNLIYLSNNFYVVKV